MALQRHPSIPLLTQDSFTAVTLPDRVDIVIRNDRWRLDLGADAERRVLAREPPALLSTAGKVATA